MKIINNTTLFSDKYKDHYKAVSEYSKSLSNDTNCGFRFFKDGNSTILSSSFGVQLNFLLDSLADYPTDKISTSLRNQQDTQSGLFIDHSFDMMDVTGFEEEYILWQFTYFASIALDMLNETLPFSFNFLTDLKKAGALEKWLNKQDFKNFWYTSNKLMFLFYFLTYEQERINVDNRKLIEYLFTFLDSKQDADTGFWGTQRGASLQNGMFGAAHIYLYYDFYGREINHKEKIIDNVVSLQNSNGMFGGRFGGACEDYDAIEILSVLIRHSDYKHDLIKKIIDKTYHIIQKNQNKDGGFPYSIDTRSIIERLKNKITKKEYSYNYSGWRRMKSNCFKSDIWGTYFRVLTIAKVEGILSLGDSNKYKFYSLPGWGY